MYTEWGGEAIGAVWSKPIRII